MMAKFKGIQEKKNCDFIYIVVAKNFLIGLVVIFEKCYFFLWTVSKKLKISNDKMGGKLLKSLFIWNR